MAGPVLSARARLTKVRMMSATEICHRLAYRAVIAAERWQHRTNRLTRADRLRRALRPPASSPGWEHRLIRSRVEHRARFLPGANDPVEMRRLFEGPYSQERQKALAHAEDARAHRFRFFGRTFEYGEQIPWQSDPATGRPWPSVYHADVPVHGGDVGFGDVKHVWELNRQQFMIDLGKAWFLARRREDLDAVHRLVRSWIEGNPYATGVNWACALEPAFRVFSWLWAYHLTCQDLEDDLHIAWLTSFHDHGRFIARHLEHYSSPYNHLMGEAAALYMLGACFPEFRASSRWRRLGRAVIEGRLAEQFYADGGSVEQSFFYHHATVGFLILACLTARSVGEEMPPSVWTAIERGIEFSARLVQPDGTIPAVGGADDGMPIRMEHLPLWDFRPYQAIGAVLFGRPGFKAIAGRFHEDALWLLGPAGLEAFDRLECRTPPPASHAFTDSGYCVMRSDWSRHADYALFDCGEQAAGLRTDAVPNSMHGHADCLSVVAWLSGRRVLVDSGLYSYNCGGVWEAHFRETAAHNTARIDGRDQATHIGKMAWSHSYRAALDGWHAAGREAWALGSHDGYVRAAGVTHRRGVWLRPGGYLVICDMFEGDGRHQLEINYQFAPGRLERIEHAAAVFDDHTELVWTGRDGWHAAISCGGPNPQDGWIAPSLGILQPAPRLTLTTAMDGATVFLVTVVAARTSGERRTSVVNTMHGAGIVAVAGAGHTDFVTVPVLSAEGPIRSDAVIAIARLDDDGTVSSSLLGGTGVDVDTAAIQALARAAASASR
jgi:uncharacterized heparinase superfamily protein